jgi:hypothetical protein
MFGEASMSGSLSLRVVPAWRRDLALRLEAAAWRVRQFARYGWRELPLGLVLVVLPALRRLVPGLNVVHSSLHLVVRRADGSVLDLGRHRHLVVTAGKNAIAGAFNNAAPEPELFKFHGFGTGTTAAAAGDTALQTEMTTAYNPDSTRPTGSQANSTNTYTTVGTVTPDAAVVVTEWGLLTQAATGGGTLLDRQVFSAINLNGSGDSLQATYVLTIS